MASAVLIYLHEAWVAYSPVGLGHRRRHSRLARLSILGRNIVVEDSGHFIQNDQAAFVVRSLLQMVTRYRTGSAGRVEASK